MGASETDSAGTALGPLADELQAISPGFAGRLRDLERELEDQVAPASMEALGGALRRVVALEGAGREAGLALAALPAPVVDGLGSQGLLSWVEGVERIGHRSVRAGQSFAIATLGVLAHAPEAIERISAGAEAVAELAERHRTDPLVPRLAAASGEALATRGGAVVEAWLRYCEAAVFGARRATAQLAPLPVAEGLADAELVAALRLATEVARLDRLGGRKVFEALPAALSGVPPASRPAVTALGGFLAGDAGELLDVLEVVGPVLRRLEPASRVCVLEQAEAVARAVRAAASRFLRTVLRVGDAVGYGDALRAFVREGLSLAEVQPVAAEAFFGLETRGARAFLTRHDAAVLLEDVETTLRGYLHLVEGGRSPLVGAEGRGLFAPLLPDGSRIVVSERVAIFPTWEENFTLMKFQATLVTLWRQEGTFAFSLAQWLESDAEGGLEELFRHFENADAAAGIFVHLEALRMIPLIEQHFPGLAADLGLMRRRIFARDEVDGRSGASTAILFLALGGRVEMLRGGDASWKPIYEFARAAQEGTATVYDSARCTALLSRMLAEDEVIPVQNIEDLLAEDPAIAYLLDLEDDDTPVAPGEVEGGEELSLESHAGEGERSDETSPVVPVDPALLEAYLRENPDLTVRRAEGPLDPSGLFVAGLTGQGLADGGADPQGNFADTILARGRPNQKVHDVHLHDEWDHRIEDYRVGWCHVHDLDVEGDSGTFFREALTEHRELLPEVRRQFQCVKPEGYRVLRRLLDGEDFDLNAVVDARADLRARHDSSPKLYTARKRDERDVATLFLLDMSASTDEETEKPPPPEIESIADDPFDLPGLAVRERSRRIIDIQKEALVIMAQALEEIGDLYAIYGFSGHGRKQVELFGIKSFDESLTMGVRGRIGGIEPKRSTRMGAALRQAMTHFRPVAARAKHLILLSDGFPQDFDYGDDRRSNVYGLKDTAMALREAEQAGISTFCITVDRAGNDYLREMCEPDRYLVINEIEALPLELPKIYSQATRGN